MSVLSEILRGGCDQAREAGIEIVGGHSVDDAEPKYGLVVTGLAPAKRVLTNVGAMPGDALVLTKPLGSGILATAMKRNLLSVELQQRVVDVMATLNRAASESLNDLEIHALTDVTGFGLLGHLAEMLTGSRVSARLEFDQIPLLGEVERFAQEGVYPGGAKRNLERIAPQTTWSDTISQANRLVLADPQTSGGLLIAVAPGDLSRLLDRLQRAKVLSAAVIGEVTAPDSHQIHVTAPSANSA